MLSMSGYGKGVAESNDKSVTIELKSVNHRFLDLSIKMPRAFNCLEEKIRGILKDRLARGHVDVFVNVNDLAGGDLSVQLNKKAIAEYLAYAKEIEDEFDIENDIEVSDLFKLKDVFTDVEITPDIDAIWTLIERALNEAIDNLITMRKTEGDKIEQNILEKLNNIKTSVEAIEEYAPRQVDEFRTKLTQRVTEILGEVPVDETKLLNEVIFYADKVAVDEEFVRLYAHINHFKEMMASEQSVGRSFDFIVQEMNREANTIGSKCSDLSVANNVLSMKTEIEKLREQIQNIE